MQYCDLHTHSVFSDGTCTPRELLCLAEKAGLGAIALTDHNTVAGLPDFLEAAKEFSLLAIPGIEFSTDYEGDELHILALYVGEAAWPEITEKMEDYQRRKEQSNARLVENLNRAGYPVDYEAIKAGTATGKVNRAHIAMALTEAGFTATRDEAFRTLLGSRCGYYQPPAFPDALETIRYIRSIGATAVLAHPYLSMDQEKLERFLPLAREAGLQAMETLYVTYDEKTTLLALETAAAFGLKSSGGSDFHGGNKPDIRLGEGRGGLHLPLQLALSLKPC